MRRRHGLPRRPSLSTSREPQDPRAGSPHSSVPDSRPARPSNRAGRTWRRPSLLLWRHRHLVVAVCLGTAVLVALSVLRPGPERGQQVLVASRSISAGALLTEQDVSTSTLPAGSIPQSPLTSTGQAVGSRAAISLEKGTVLTASMTSGGLAQQLGADERLVQVPIDVGAELARPGARVDVIGQAPEGWTPQTQEDASQGAAAQNPTERPEASAAPSSPESSSTTSPLSSPNASSSLTNQGSPGFQESSQSISQGISGGPFGTHSTVLCSRARVVTIQQVGEGGRWTENKKVTLITLAIPSSSAILVVGAATNSTLGIALSP